MYLKKTTAVLVAIMIIAVLSTPVAFAADQQEQNNGGQSQNVQLTLKVKSAKAKSITLKWNAVKGATKVELYRAVKTKKKYKKIKTFKPGVKTFTDKKVSMKKRYYYGLTATVGEEEISSNYVIKSKVRGKYKRGSVYGPSLSKKKLNKVRDLVANVVNKYQIELAPMKDRIYMIHDYLVWKVSYHSNGRYVGSALGALKYKKAQCSGYSRAFVALCDGAGVKSRYVHASGSASNPYHQWNMVKLKGKWYLIDVQGNDSSRFDMCFLLGRDKMKGFYKKAYRYRKKGYPPLAKKSMPARKYRYFGL